MYDFDDTVSEHKSNLIQSMRDFGEEKRIHHLLKDIDLNICDYEFYFYKGQQSRQEEVDKLQSQIDELKWMLKNSNGQADEFCKKYIELQKRIDVCEKLRDSQFDKLWNLTKAIEDARVDADEDFDLFLNYLSNILKGE